MTELANREQAGALAINQPGRPLGMKTQPELRLSLGYQDENRGGAPVKTDYFRVRNPDEVPDLAAKFLEQFGEKPNRLPIMLPSTLEQAIDIHHAAFSGGQGGGGGVLKARGSVNFAIAGTYGGPDVLTVWGEAEQPEKVQISGVDDAKAQALDVELRMTFRFMLPAVVGVGGFVAVDSKGKQSIDSIWQKLVELYGIFGPRITLAVQPELRLRKATGRYYDKKKKKWSSTSYYALDLVVPESFDAMFTRLQERNATLAPRELVALPASVSSATDPGAATEQPPPAPAEAPLPRTAPAAVKQGDGEPADEDSTGQTSLIADPATPAQRDRLAAALSELRMQVSQPPDIDIDEETSLTFELHDWEGYGRAYVEKEFGKHNSAELTSGETDRLIEHLESLRIPF